MLLLLTDRKAKGMKAKEVLRQYDDGIREFPRANLRGQSFKGKNLSGANFKNADITGAIFTNANLEGTDFSGATAGMQRRVVLGIVTVSVILSALSGCFLAFAVRLLADIFTANISQSDTIVLAVWILGAIASFFFATIRLGLGGASAFAALLVPCLALAGELKIEALTKCGIGLALLVVAVALIAVGVAVVAVAARIPIEIAAFIAVLIVLLPVFAEGFKLLSILSALLAAAIVVLSSYIAKRSLNGDANHAFIHKFVLQTIATGGTFFRGANLTNANFKDA